MNKYNKLINALEVEGTVFPLIKKKAMTFEKISNKITYKKFGEMYERFVAYMISGANNFEDYVVKNEDNSVKTGGNNGVDIIFPDEQNDKIIFMQVKSFQESPEKKSHSISKLKSRAYEFLDDVQNSDTTIEDMVNRWKLNSKTIKKIKDRKDDWEICIVWHQPVKEYKDKTFANSPDVEQWGQSELMTFNINAKAPFEKISDSNDYTFKVTSNFSSSANKCIEIKEGKKISSLIVPTKIKDIIRFLNGVELQEDIYTQNVRDFQGETKISESIVKTLKDNPEDFYLMNNGITIIADKISLKKNNINYSYTLEGIKVINGQQTMWSIYGAAESMSISEDAYVLLRVYSLSSKDKIRNIASSTNTQKLIRPEEIYSTFDIHKKIFAQLKSVGIFYKFRSGKPTYESEYKGWPVVKIADLLKYWVLKESGNAAIKNHKNPLMEIFVNPKGNIGTQFKLYSTRFNNPKMEKTILVDLVKTSINLVNSRSYKDKLHYAEAYDLFLYYYLTDPTQSSTAAFITKFNECIKVQAKKTTSYKNTKNIASSFKSQTSAEEIKVHTDKLFKFK